MDYILSLSKLKHKRKLNTNMQDGLEDQSSEEDNDQEMNSEAESDSDQDQNSLKVIKKDKNNKIKV